MGLVELGKHTSLSAALLSKLERGKLFPTLPTLLRIAMVFGVGLDYFFTDERKRRIVGVVRKDERVRFPERPGAQDVQYFFECLDYRATERKLSAFLADFQEVPQEKLKPHQHAGIEFLYVLKGSLAIKIGSDEYVLEAEDAIYFDSRRPAQLPPSRREALHRRDRHRAQGSILPVPTASSQPRTPRPPLDGMSPPRADGT